MFPLAQLKYGPLQPITDALAKAKAYWGYCAGAASGLSRVLCIKQSSSPSRTDSSSY